MNYIKNGKRNERIWKKKSYQYIHRVGQEPFCNISLFVHIYEEFRIFNFIKDWKSHKIIFLSLNCSQLLLEPTRYPFKR